MGMRLVARLVALFGLYSIIVAVLGMRFSGQTNAGTFSLSLVEIGIVTALFILMAAFMVIRRRPPTPLE